MIKSPSISEIPVKHLEYWIDVSNFSMGFRLISWGFIIIVFCLNACKTWITYRRHTIRLKLFHQKCLRRILGIRWPMYLVDIDIHQRNQSTSIKSLWHFSTGYDGVILWSGWRIIGSLSNFSTMNWPREKDQRRNQNWGVMIASRTQFFQSFLAKWLGKSRSRSFIRKKNSVRW